jgi:hypothetical protein
MLRALNWFRRPSRKPVRRPRSAALAVESLEERQVLSAAPTDMTGVAQLFAPHNGPTVLYLNFDGGDVHYIPNWYFSVEHLSPFQAAPRKDRDQAIQDILYRVSEKFAPFNVQVERLYGAGNIGPGNGNSTVFIGADAGDVIMGTKATNSWTPSSSWDAPTADAVSSHPPNSDAWDVAFVDPVGASNTTEWSDELIADDVAHEAGHTFGLAHVLSNGVYDVMSYDTYPGYFFANNTFGITTLNYNFATRQTTPDPSEQPKWYTSGFLGFKNSYNLTTQNSYTYLRAVLGTGLNHPVADTSAVDPTYASLYERYAALAPGSNFSGSLARPGDTNVFSLTSPYSQTVTITAKATPGSTLDPVVMVFDPSGHSLLAESHASQLQFSARAGVKYKLVVAGHDGASSGAFHLAIGPLVQPGWGSLPGGWDIRQIAVGHDPWGRLEVFAVGGDHAVWVNREVYVCNPNYWTGWQSLGGWVSSIAVGYSPEDPLAGAQVFAVGSDSGLWVNSQTLLGAGSTWSGWQSLGGSGIRQLAVASGTFGGPDVFVIGSDHAVWYRAQDLSHHFSGWGRIGGWVSSIAAGEDIGGRVEVFGIGANTGLWVSTEATFNTVTFSPWSSLGGYDLQQLAVGNNADGRLEVFALGGDHAVYHQWQDIHYNWSGWANLGGYVSGIQVGNDSQGRLEVVALDSAYHAWAIGQVVKNGGWGGWTGLGGTLEQLALGNDNNGTLDVFGLAWDSQVYHRPAWWQAARNGVPLRL